MTSVDKRRPSLIRETLSANRKTSLSRCVIHIIARPSSARRRIISKSLCVSDSVKAAVGSSKIMTFALWLKAFAIAMSCCLEMLSSLTGTDKSISSANLFIILFASVNLSFLLINPVLFRNRFCPRKIFSSPERSGIKSSSWYTMQIPFLMPSFGEESSIVLPSRIILPESLT